MISLPEFKFLVDPVDSRTIGTAAAIALLPYRTITLATTNSAVSGGSEFGFLRCASGSGGALDDDVVARREELPDIVA